MPDKTGNPLPPEALKARVIGTLRSRGILRPSRPAWRLPLTLAAALALFAGGYWAARSGSRPPDRRNTFTLLLYEGSGWQPPVKREVYRDEYAAWAQGLRSHGKLVQDMALDSTTVQLGAPASIAAQPDGFFIIRADSREEAVAIARSCPHLRHGGTVVLHPVIPD